MISILYEDEDVLAADKPEGLACIPEREKGKASLLDVLTRERSMKLYVVHRIDKEASGVVLFAKNAEAHRWLNGRFEKREIEKSYDALVFGVVAADEGFIDRPLRAFGSGRMGVDEKAGKSSLTRYRVVKRSASHTLLNVYPRTGRRHQIRVHLYGIGHAIVGDRLYGDREIQKGFTRLMLHARRIAWQTPSGEKRMAEADPPDSFNHVVSSRII